MYEKFGHTAIRVNDPITGYDVVFNFGVFDFNTKNFYLKFIKGDTDYQLAVYDTKSFLEEYKSRNSGTKTEPYFERKKKSASLSFNKL